MGGAMTETAWHAQPVAVIDFETTGPNPNECAPVQIAVSIWERGELQSIDGWLIQPGRLIPPEASNIHGITDEMVADAMETERAIDKAVAIVGERTASHLLDIGPGRVGYQR